MDKMLKIKTMLAGVWGGGSSAGAYFLSQEFDTLLSRIIKILGIISVLISIIYMWRINRRREHIKELDEIRAEGKLCDDCRNGREPKECPVPVRNRPRDCPKMKRRRQIPRLKRLANMFAGEDTTKT